MIDGNKIARLRMAIPKLTQEGLAKKVGTIGSHINQLENGGIDDPRVCTLYRIAVFFEVTLDDLMVKDGDCCS